MLQIKLRNKTDRTNRTEFDLFPFVCSFCERRQTVKIETFRQTEFAVFIKIVWCRCSASAAIQPRRLVVHSTKSPAGAVQSAQWRELDASSSRAPAESPVVIRSARRLSELRSSSVSGGTADGGKEHEGCAPSNSAAGESHLHLGNQVCRLYKNSMVQVRCICRSPAAQAGRA